MLKSRGSHSKKALLMLLEVIILAAGKGTRMCSRLPKVLHNIAGKPMLTHVIERVQHLNPQAIHVVVGHEGQQVEFAVSHFPVQCWQQEQQLGTGHAVGIAAHHVDKDATVLVMYADVPLIPADLMTSLIAKAAHNQLALLTVNLESAQGYGRIVRNQQGDIRAIVEQKDATPEQQKITEINTGIMAMPAHLLQQWLPRIQPNNVQKELYLTDIVAMAVADGITVDYCQPAFAEQAQGVNDAMQLVALERWYQQFQAQQLMQQGLRLADDKRIDIRGNLSIGQDVFIDVNCVFEGDVALDDGVTIAPNCHIKDSHIGTHSHIKTNSVLDGTTVGSHCDIGPFARLRPGTILASKAKIGNFVETKKTTIGDASKVNHFTYLGDAKVGKGVNIGAGTITCNYDGANKHITTIEDEVFIGSNASLVAPVTIGKDATVGAGSTIVKDVPEKSLAIGRGQQKIIPGWVKPTKKGS